MTYDLGCWDCPVPVFRAVIPLLTGIGMVWFSRTLARHQLSGLRLLGAILLGLAVAWYFLIAYGILKFGVLWNLAWFRPDRVAEWRLQPWADKGLVLGWLVASVALLRPLGRARS